MKKTNLSRKTNAVRDAKPSQKKISMYFTNASKDEVFKDKDSMINSIIGNSTSSEGVCKKRKLSGDLELLETRMKIVKSDDTSDAYNSNTLHEQNYAFTSESNAICNISRDKRKCVIETSPKKNLTIGEYKENIDLDRCKNIVYKQNEKKVEPLNIQSVNKKENRTNSVENESINASDFALETCIMDNFNDCFEEEWCVDNQINFDSFQRCTVTDVKNEYSSTLLTVEQEESALSGTVMCSGFWKDVKVKKYDIVAIQARKESRYWVVDNTSGFLVIHSDMLISGTTVVSGLFCSRKAVLAEKFKKLESLPYFEGDQTPLVIGSLAHQLLQKAICENVHVMSDITKLLDEILQSKETISTLYATEIKFDECRKQMLAFVPKIFNFIRHYLKDEKQQEISNIKDSFKGRITRVRDIEENIWLPKLGVKGKVDVTVEVSLNSKRKLMPLEIKTGKPSFSLEHRGQLILYIMMMALTGQDTDTGLLLYLRENNMQEIKCKHPEKRDLILLRNTIANYIAPKLVDKSLELTSEPDLKMLQLPEPINHHRACSTCSYNALCCSYLSRDPEIQLSESHPLAQLSKQILEKFKPTHIDYIIKWVSLLQIEENAQTSDNITRYMWTLSPEKREEKKLCISNLKLISKVVEHSSKYQHTFGRGDVDIPYTEFSENEYVIVSTDTRVNVSAGFIMHIEKYSITVLLDRDISKYNINESLHIDKYSHSTLFSLNIANVGGLLGDNEICAKLRDIVIDRKPATFSKGVPHSIVRKSAEIIHELNENQQRAVLKAMSANEYILIKGMPGTGKTQTLVALISLLNKTGYSVLIAGYTNGCVDNILLRLLEKGVDFLRLGSSAVHPLVQHKSERHMIANCNSVESLETVYSSKNIVGVTCASSNHVLLSKRTFDVCIVDESAQALQSSVLRPLYSAHKFVLVGDPDQLPPIVKSKTARKLGADESLFSRLDSANNTITLTKQYRMNKIIMRLANKFTYNDALEVGSASIESATFAATNSENLAKEGKWIQQALSQSIHDSVVLLNTGCTSDMKMSIESSDKYLGSDQKHSNVWEVAVIMNLLQALFKMNVDHRSIGIIAPYRAHVSLLKGIVPNSIEVNTVDQYQGRDKEIIIYTCARSSSSNNIINKDLEILGDHRRLTVAITRAKHKLIIIADTSTVSQYLPFKKLFNFVEDKNIINLRDCCDDFSWRSVATLLQGHAF
ncbi:DNA replication ATP-dependent helicase/nuclease DNA2 isoform X1 [Hylaeus anthracinus]|uniref:DNA replication ATP-dependent helicase/nuclease DNA2 isoform X1 n=2 Tax=Hylaeus anthracinus TaxID=313031 RepID=UPI0023BA03DE|nr:DNA replication ATP-dependent helicase/nuclease DNA2 isoform X1 [Hylaeus anthracinus]